MEEPKMKFEFKMEPTLRYAVHRDWGLYYKKKHLLDSAQHHFTESYNLDESNILPLLERSCCKLQRSYVDDAIKDAEYCLKLNPVHLASLHQRNDCIYEQNNFEDSLKHTYNTLYLNDKIKNKIACTDKLITMNANLNHAIGSEGGPCLHKMRKEIAKIQKEASMRTFDKRAMWKILRDKGECDVISERHAKIKKVC